MFDALKKLVFRDSRTVVQRYTQDLSEITLQIHTLEKKLQRGQITVNSLQSQLTLYGTALSCVVIGYEYLNNTIPQLGPLKGALAALLVCLIVLLVCKWSCYKLYDKYDIYQQRRLNQLKSTHLKKLNELKEETNFHETNSIIQRFTSGEDQSEDAMIIIDEELKDKYTELNDLKIEMEQLKIKNDKKALNKEERDVWFDKVIGVLAGGNDLNNLPKPILCSNCKKHSGAYRIQGKPLIYICPYCDYKIDECIKKEEAIVSETINEVHETTPGIKK